MLFDPPYIENIKQVLPVVKDNPAFIVKDQGFFTVIDYIYMSDKLFHNPIERECRGIKFCSRTGDVLARPLHKFHNLNERPAFATDKVDLRQPHVVLDKLDGSMVHTCATSMGIYLMTRKGLSPVAEKADAFLMANQIKYGRLFNSLGVENYTYIFEYVGPTNKIVLDYTEEQLILTAIRHNYNGTYIFYDEMEKLAKHFDIPLVGYYGSDPDWTPSIEGWHENIALASGVEGAVLRFDTGEMIKIKADEYCRKHKSKELASSFKGLVGLIVEDKLDDILPQLDEPHLSMVKKFNEELLEEMNDVAELAKTIVRDNKHLTQKEFALHIKANFGDVLHPIFFNVRKGDLAYQAVRHAITKNLSTNKKVSDYFEKMGYPMWTFTFFGEE